MARRRLTFQFTGRATPNCALRLFMMAALLACASPDARSESEAALSEPIGTPLAHRQGAEQPVSETHARPVNPEAAVKRTLQYLFPQETTIRRSAAPAEYVVEIRGTERIERRGRAATIEYGGKYNLDLTFGALRAGDDPDVKQLKSRLVDFQLSCAAGAGSYAYTVGPETGMVEESGGQVRSWSPHEPYSGRYSIAVLLEQQGVIRMRNGALLEEPIPPSLVDALGCVWATNSISMLMPPLPSRPVSVGREWSAGVPVYLSTYARPHVMRVECEYRSYNKFNGAAEVAWHTDVNGIGLRPTAVSHIGDDSVASGTVTGRMLIEVETGRIIHSTAMVSVRIERLSKPDAVVAVNLSFSMSRRPEIDEDSGAGSGSFDEEEEDDDDDEFDDDGFVDVLPQR